MTVDGITSFTWFNPTKIVYGAGSISTLGEAVSGISGESARVLLVTGREHLRSTGLLEKIVEDIGPEQVTLFDKVGPYPSPTLVDEAVGVCRSSSSELVVAVGGGSALDLGKAVAVLSCQSGSSREYVYGERKLSQKGLPFIAVPTTSGSSSEVTSGAALWDMENKALYSMSHPIMFPDVAIVDPQLSMSMGQRLTSVTGMDAFTSAFESYWSTESGPLSDTLDLRVIGAFSDHLENSTIRGDLESRSVCALAATMSGIAYSNSRPNICHRIGSPLTLYWGIAHGQAVGVSLSAFLRWNAPAIGDRLPALLNVLKVEDVDGASRRITQIMERCGLKTRLRDLGIKVDELNVILDTMKWTGSATVGSMQEVLPRTLRREDAKRILEDIF